MNASPNRKKLTNRQLNIFITYKSMNYKENKKHPTGKFPVVFNTFLFIHSTK